MTHTYSLPARAARRCPSSRAHYLLLLLSLLLFPWAARAQTPAFSTSRTTGITYTSIGATGASFTFQNASADDNTSTTVALPSDFAFSYLGTPITSFRACLNGWIALNSSTTSYAYLNDLGGTNISLMLAPMWDDLVCQGYGNGTASLAASMKYQISGTAPNRVLTVEWLGMEVFANDGPNLNFQVKLYETTNIIQYQYGVMSGFDGRRDYSYTYSLGLTGSTPSSSYLAQQTANSNFFAQANAVGQNAGANGLSIVPASFSQVQFVPAATLTTGTNPGAVVPANNEPAGAFTLPLIFFSPTSFATTYTSANATASAGITACAATSPGNPDDDVWFTFALSRAQPVTVTLRSSGGYDGVLQVFSNAGTTALACENSTGLGLTENYNATLPAGTYYVRVYNAGVGSGTTGQFALAAYVVPPAPANNECTAAVTLSSSGTCTPISGTSLGATASAGVAACVGTPDDDVWYSFTTAATARSYTLTMQGSADYDGVVQVLSGACGGLSSVSCTNATLSGGAEVVTLNSLTPNTTYFVRVYEFATGYSSGDFTLCLTDNFPRITSFTPTSGPMGTRVTLTGTGLAGATSVRFNGTAQTTFISNTATGIVLTVPVGATTGTLTVTTPVGTSGASSQTFTVAPVLISVAPAVGGRGQTITLTGTALQSPTALTINGANALAGIVSNTGTRLVVRVPVTAAASGEVSITTADGTATTPFRVMSAPGNALAFDGADDYLNLASGLNTDNFTFEAWVNYQDNGIWARIFDFGTGINEWMMLTPRSSYAGEASGKLAFGITLTGGGGSESTITSTTALPIGRWQHVAVTLATTGGVTSGTLYLNGQIIGTNPDLGISPAALGALPNNWLGRSQYTQDPFLRSRLDEVRIWNTARTQAQIQADMVASATAPFPAGLVLYLNFDQGEPATASTGANTGLTTLYDLVSAQPATLTYFDLSSGNTTSNYVESYALAVPTATAATNRQPNSFTATWTAPAVGTVTSYVLDVATNAAFTAPVTGSPFTVAAPATSYPVTGVRNGGTYYYRVRALNAPLADQGAFSNTALVATPLPVELTAFTATAEGPQTVRLAWATASERNSARFEVERSLDGRTFQTIGTVPAAGSSTLARSYSLPDQQLPARTSPLYYRLRQVDLDGTVAYSSVQVVTRAGQSRPALTLAPNPTQGTTTLHGAAASTPVQVYDAVGRLVLTARTGADGSARLVLPAALPTGVYVVRCGAQAGRLVLE